MARRVLRGRLLKWGHTTGIRLPTRDAARLDIPLGTEVKVTVEPATSHRLHEVLTVHGGPTASRDHDRVFAQGWAARKKQ